MPQNSNKIINYPKNNHAPLVESYNMNKHKRCKTEDYKLPKIGGVTFKSNYKAFRTTHDGPLDEIYYKEATRSSKMNSTQRSKYKTTIYEVILMKLVMKEVVLEIVEVGMEAEIEMEAEMEVEMESEVEVEVIKFI